MTFLFNVEAELKSFDYEYTDRVWSGKDKIFFFFTHKLKLFYLVFLYLFFVSDITYYKIIFVQ